MAIDSATGTESLENALGGMFEPPPKPAKVAVEPLPDTPEAEEANAAAIVGEEPDIEREQETGPEPEYEIEVEGQREIVRGNAQIKEMLQKAVHYSRGAEQNARMREALVAQAQHQQITQQFSQAVAADVQEFQQLHAQLEQFKQLDWNTLMEQDFVKAFQLRQARDDLREKAQAKAQAIHAKQNQFEQSQAYAAQQILASETQALVAKLPEWRNSEKAHGEKQQLIGYLSNEGFNGAEIGGLTDHRALLIVRKAWMYDQLQAGKTAGLKQVRAAPPVVRPGTAATQQTSKTDFLNSRMELRKLGQQGKPRAQEALMEKMLNKAFK